MFRLADAAVRSEIGGQSVLVLVLALCGLRWGEVAGLKVGRLDLLHRRLVVAGAAVEGCWSSRMENASEESPSAGADTQLPGRPTDVGNFRQGALDDLVFTTWRERSAAGISTFAVTCSTELPTMLVYMVDPARTETYRGLAGCVGRGERQGDSKMLGHASAAMTLDVYSGLFDDDLDGVAASGLSSSTTRLTH